MAGLLSLLIIIIFLLCCAIFPVIEITIGIIIIFFGAIIVLTAIYMFVFSMEDIEDFGTGFLLLLIGIIIILFGTVFL